MSIRSSDPGFAIAAVSPLDTAIARNAELTDSLAGSPNETLDSPHRVFIYSSFEHHSIRSSVMSAAFLSELTVMTSPSTIISSFV